MRHPEPPTQQSPSQQWLGAGSSTARDRRPIGELAIVAMPGEPFAEISAEVRKRSPFAFAMFCGYSDGVGSNYMPTAHEYAPAATKSNAPPTAPAPTKAVIEASVRLLEGLR